MIDIAWILTWGDFGVMVIVAALMWKSYRVGYDKGYEDSSTDSDKWDLTRKVNKLRNAAGTKDFETTLEI